MAKKKKTTPEYNSERETRVLLEQIHSQIKTVAEQHGTIIKKLEGHDDKFEKIDQRFNTLEMATMENGRQIKRLKAGQDELKVDMEESKARQERIEKKLDTNLSEHDRRITKLEEKVRV